MFTNGIHCHPDLYHLWFSSVNFSRKSLSDTRPPWQRGAMCSGISSCRPPSPEASCPFVAAELPPLGRKSLPSVWTCQEKPWESVPPCLQWRRAVAIPAVCPDWFESDLSSILPDLPDFLLLSWHLLPPAFAILHPAPWLQDAGSSSKLVRSLSVSFAFLSYFRQERSKRERERVFLHVSSFIIYIILWGEWIWQ